MVVQRITHLRGKLLHDHGHRLSHGFPARINHDIRVLGCFIRGLQTGKVLDLIGACSLVQTLGIPHFTHRQRRIHEDLHEKNPRGLGIPTRSPPVLSKGRNERDDND